MADYNVQIQKYNVTPQTYDKLYPHTTAWNIEEIGSVVKIGGGTAPYSLFTFTNMLIPLEELNIPPMYSYSITALTPGTSALTTGKLNWQYESLPPVFSDDNPSFLWGINEYNSAQLSVSGASPFVFTIKSGNLPAGVSLDAMTGVISGTPTASGTFNSVVTATNSDGTADTAIRLVIEKI